MALSTRDLFGRQRTQTINALRGHLAEHRVTAAVGMVHLSRLQAAVNDPDTLLPEAVVHHARLMFNHIKVLRAEIIKLEYGMRHEAGSNEVARRLMTLPGFGPITAVALTALSPDPDRFDRGRDFAAWTGLTPRKHSSGGKERIKRTSKIGQRDLRRLLILGAAWVVRWAVHQGARQGGWLGQMLARDPRRLVTVALANKMARVAWAIVAKGKKYSDLAAS